MADLSNLLGDVYGEPTDEGAAPPVPAWAADERLDEAFADWSPEPLEPAVADTPTVTPTRPPAPAASTSATSAPLDDDLAAALSAALADAPRPPAAPVASFTHVSSTEQVDPAVLDIGTLEPTTAPSPADVPAEPVMLEPPTEVVEPTPKAKRRSFSRRPKAVATPAAVAVEPVAAVEAVVATAPSIASDRPWQRTDDDILPARNSGGRKSVSVSFRLR